jgi:uncharacterized protein YbjT (DUF2867 family)
MSTLPPVDPSSDGQARLDAVYRLLVQIALRRRALDLGQHQGAVGADGHAVEALAEDAREAEEQVRADAIEKQR